MTGNTRLRINGKELFSDYELLFFGISFECQGPFVPDSDLLPPMTLGASVKLSGMFHISSVEKLLKVFWTLLACFCIFLLVSFKKLLISAGDLMR
jgi:hypothetical protein